MKILLHIVLFFQFIYANDIYYYNGSEKISLTPVSSISRSVSSVDYYEDENGHLLGVADRLIVAFKDSVDIEMVLNQYNVEVISKLSKNSYLLKTNDKTETLNIANQLNTLPEVLYAHPDFIKRRFKR